MKANKVFENIEFKRGGSTTKSLGVGVYKEIEDILSKEYLKKRPTDVTYTIVSKDCIIIRYQPEFIKMLKPNPERDNLPIYIIKYSTIDPYFVKEFETSGYSMYDKEKYKYVGVGEKTFYFYARRPEQMKIDSDVLVKISADEANAKEKCEVMAKALNAEYGPISGFEFIEEYSEPVEHYESRVDALIKAYS